VAAALGDEVALSGNLARGTTRAMEALSLKPVWKRLWQAPVARLLPRLIVIGAQKGGTTALAKYLAQHSGFLASREKEVSYFGCPPCYSKGPRWYASQWNKTSRRGQRGAWSKVIRFEASPHYMRAPQAAAEMHECIADVRLIALLRDPADRAYSAWKMYRRYLAGNPSFFEEWNRTCYSPQDIAAFEPRTQAELDDFCLAIEREAACIERGRSMEWSLLEYGLYGSQLRRYLEFFPRKQLLVLESDDLKQRSAETLNRVLDFMGLEPWDWSRADLSPAFASAEAAAMPARGRDFLREYYHSSNRMLQGMLEPLPVWAVG